MESAPKKRLAGQFTGNKIIDTSIWIIIALILGDLAAEILVHIF
jgi:hypothetical protein